MNFSFALKVSPFRDDSGCGRRPRLVGSPRQDGDQGWPWEMLTFWVDGMNAAGDVADPVSGKGRVWHAGVHCDAYRVVAMLQAGLIEVDTVLNAEAALMFGIPTTPDERLLRQELSEKAVRGAKWIVAQLALLAEIPAQDQPRAEELLWEICMERLTKYRGPEDTEPRCEIYFGGGPMDPAITEALSAVGRDGPFAPEVVYRMRIDASGVRVKVGDDEEYPY